MTRARSFLAVKTLEISESVAGNVMAAPSPITDLATMSCAGPVVKPPARLAAPNTVSPASSMPLRPNRSDRLPKVSSSAAKTRLKESTTHCSWVVVACSSRTRAGSATFTRVVSRLTRNAASSSATRIRGLDRIVSSPALRSCRGHRAAAEGPGRAVLPGCPAQVPLALAVRARLTKPRSCLGTGSSRDGMIRRRSGASPEGADEGGIFRGRLRGTTVRPGRSRGTTVPPGIGCGCRVRGSGRAGGRG